MHRTSAKILIVITKASIMRVTFAFSLCYPSFVLEINIPSKTLQNLETKAIETKTGGVRREVLEKERKVEKEI